MPLRTVRLAARPGCLSLGLPSFSSTAPPAFFFSAPSDLFLSRCTQSRVPVRQRTSATHALACTRRSSGPSSPSLKVVLPAVLSGLMWGVAQTCWFVANGLLSFSVAFPIITSAPGLVAALWGVFVFGEIAGRRNYAILVLAATLNITAAVLIALSR